MSSLSSKLPAAIHHGVLNVPGPTAESKRVAERLLEQDRNTYHCFWGDVSGLHSHLSHHILAAYDLGASAQHLQAIYDKDKDGLDPIHLANRKTKAVEEQHVDMTQANWHKYLGVEKYYATFVKFFTSVIADIGVGQTLEQYVFAPEVNERGVYMFARFMAGIMHPLIQNGYAVEFGSDAMLAQGLAQAAVHNVEFVPELFDFETRAPTIETALEILRKAYDSTILRPVMPYKPNALVRERAHEVCQDGRPAEVVKLVSSWKIDVSGGQEEFDRKVQELFWLTTLVFAGTGKPGRRPRLDFFLMHMCTMNIFIPSLIKAIPNTESKVKLLRAALAVILMQTISRGRPRINPKLLMSYTAVPRPPNSTHPQPFPSTVGDPRNDAYVNPWPEIVASSLHHPDAHTMKAVRSLYYAAQHYGTTEAGKVPGAIMADGRESHEGMAEVDGTLFVRAAGVVMDTLGWVRHGQEEGGWDRSALGWDEAWNNED